MIKIFLSTIILFGTLFAKDLKPSFIFEASGGVTDIVSYNNKLFVATQASAVDIFDLKTRKLIQTIKVPQIKDFMGDIIDAKIYNTDILKDKILFVAQHESGFRELYIYTKGKLNKVINSSQKLYISKAKFLTSNLVLLSSLGNEMFLYDLNSNTIKWQIDVRAKDAEFNSTFADFTLNEDKTLAVVADESGDLKIVDIKTHTIIKILAGHNLDKVFKVDFKNNKIITAGQDGRCVVYNLNNDTAYFLREEPNWFIIYGAGLSPSGKLGAYSSDENNNVTIFNTDTKTKIFKLKDNSMTLSSTLFISEDEIFVGTDSNKFNYYKLK